MYIMKNNFFNNLHIIQSFVIQSDNIIYFIRFVLQVIKLIVKIIHSPGHRSVKYSVNST